AQDRRLRARIGAEGGDHGLLVGLDDIDPRKGPEREGERGHCGDGAGPDPAAGAAEHRAQSPAQLLEAGVHVRTARAAWPARSAVLRSPPRWVFAIAVVAGLRRAPRA